MHVIVLMSAIPNPAEFQHLNAHVPKVALPAKSTKPRNDGCDTAAFYRSPLSGFSKYQPVGAAYGMGRNCKNGNNNIDKEAFRYMYKVPK